MSTSHHIIKRSNRKKELINFFSDIFQSAVEGHRFTEVLIEEIYNYMDDDTAGALREKYYAILKKMRERLYHNGASSMGLLLKEYDATLNNFANSMDDPEFYKYLNLLLKRGLPGGASLNAFAEALPYKNNITKENAQSVLTCIAETLVFGSAYTKLFLTADEVKKLYDFFHKVSINIPLNATPYTPYKFKEALNKLLKQQGADDDKAVFFITNANEDKFQYIVYIQSNAKPILNTVLYPSFSYARQEILFDTLRQLPTHTIRIVDTYLAQDLAFELLKKYKNTLSSLHDGTPKEFKTFMRHYYHSLQAIAMQATVSDLYENPFSTTSQRAADPYQIMQSVISGYDTKGSIGAFPARRTTKDPAGMKFGLLGFSHLPVVEKKASVELKTCFGESLTLSSDYTKVVLTFENIRVLYNYFADNNISVNDSSIESFRVALNKLLTRMGTADDDSVVIAVKTREDIDSQTVYLKTAVLSILLKMIEPLKTYHITPQALQKIFLNQTPPQKKPKDEKELLTQRRKDLNAFFQKDTGDNNGVRTINFAGAANRYGYFIGITTPTARALEKRIGELNAPQEKVREIIEALEAKYNACVENNQKAGFLTKLAHKKFDEHAQKCKELIDTCKPKIQNITDNTSGIVFLDELISDIERKKSSTLANSGTFLPIINLALEKAKAARDDFYTIQDKIRKGSIAYSK